MGCGVSIVNISSAIFDCSAPDFAAYDDVFIVGPVHGNGIPAALRAWIECQRAAGTLAALGARRVHLRATHASASEAMGAGFFAQAEKALGVRPASAKSYSSSAIEGLAAPSAALPKREL